MKCTNTLIGKIAEDHAFNYLVAHNYHILERNWRYKRAELDIIVNKDEVLIFIEVKSRSSDYFGEPENAIDTAKQRLIFDASQAYMDSISYAWAVRYDIISIKMDAMARPVYLKHIKDTFF